jgi:uncharacterized protein
MQMRVVDNPDRQRYEVFADDELAGFTTYRRRGDRIALNHTEIDSGFEGRGVGSVLVARTLDDLRRRGLAVLPFCPFVKSFIERHRDYADLVPTDDRARFGL